MSQHDDCRAAEAHRISRRMSRPIFSRLNLLFHALRATGTPITAGHMANRFNVDEKTIHRDIETLRDQGVDVLSSRNGGLKSLGIRGGGFKIADDAQCPFCGKAEKK